MIPKLIIEGVNLAGKSSVINALKRDVTDATVVTRSAYPAPWRQEIDAAMVNGEADAIVDNLRVVTRQTAQLLAANEPVLVQRLHLTAVVYLGHYYQRVYEDRGIEALLNRHGVGLVVLTADHDEMRRRYDQRIEAANKDNGPWRQVLASFDSLVERSEYYNRAFAASAIERKLLVDTTEKRPEDVSREILTWFASIKPCA